MKHALATVFVVAAAVGVRAQQQPPQPPTTFR